MNKTNPAVAVALLLSTLGMAALPHAIRYEAPHHAPSLVLAALPYVVGLAIGIALWLAIRQTRFKPAKAPPLIWLVISFAVMLPPFAGETVYGRHQYPFEVDPTLIGLPFFAAWAAALGQRMGQEATPMPWLCVLGGVALLVAATWLAAILIPSVHILLFPLLLLLAGNATLRRIGAIAAGGAALTVLAMLISRPFTLDRIINHGFFPYVSMGNDPYGTGYQTSHIWMLLHNLSWFGTGSVIHLPEASRQLLPVAIADSYGGLAFAGLFLLVAFWFYLTRPGKTSSSPLGRFGDMVWWALLYLAIINAAGNLLIIGPIGGGMPMLSSNPALIALALLVTAIRAQPAVHVDQRRSLIAMSAWTVMLAMALAVMGLSHTATDAKSSIADDLAGRALDRAMKRQLANHGAVVILDAESGAAVSMVERHRKGDDSDALDVDFAPGPTLAPFLAAALIDRGLLKPESVISSKSLVLPGGMVVRDANPTKDGGTVREIITGSSRVGAAHMAGMLSADGYKTLLATLGIDSHTGQDETDLTLLGLAEPGGGIEVNLRQLAHAYLSLAGDGVARLTDIGRLPPAKRLQRLFSPSTARTVRDMLADTASETDAATSALKVAGKAGSIVTPIAARALRHTALFVGIAPLEHPRYVVAVMLEREGGEALLGDAVAKPVFAEIVRELNKTEARQ